jgi:hypothetical protein
VSKKKRLEYSFLFFWPWQTGKCVGDPNGSKYINLFNNFKRNQVDVDIVIYTKYHPSCELRGDSFVGMDDVFRDADEFSW